MSLKTKIKNLKLSLPENKKNEYLKYNINEAFAHLHLFASNKIELELTGIWIEPKAIQIIYRHLKIFKITGSENDKKILEEILNTKIKLNHKYLKVSTRFNPSGIRYIYTNKELFVCNSKFVVENELLGNEVLPTEKRTILIGEKIRKIKPSKTVKVNHAIEMNKTAEKRFESDLNFDLLTGNWLFNDKVFRNYIYDVIINPENNLLEIKVFHFGYLKSDVQAEVKGNLKVVDVYKDDLGVLLYSKKSKEYDNNFITYKFELTAGNISFDLKEDFDTVRYYAVKSSFKEFFNEKYIITIDLEEGIKISENPHQNIYPEQYLIYQKNFKKPVILFSDRQDKAGDNAEALYEYMLSTKHKFFDENDCYFAIKKESKDYARLKRMGFNLVEFGSLEHIKYYINASAIVSSHAAKRIYSPLLQLDNNMEQMCNYKLIFLQHGIIMGDHSGFLDILNTKVDLMITTLESEYKLVKEFSHYPNIKRLGMARQDLLMNKIQDYVLYAPSWNVNYKKKFANSEYYYEIIKVLKLFTQRKEKLKLVLHPEFIIYRDVFCEYENEYVEVLKQEDIEYRKLLSECRYLVTDYSSLFWDILYLEKHVYLHQPYELHHNNDLIDDYKNHVKYSYTIEELANNLGRKNLSSKNFKFEFNKNDLFPEKGISRQLIVEAIEQVIQI